MGGAQQVGLMAIDEDGHRRLVAALKIPLQQGHVVLC